MRIHFGSLSSHLQRKELNHDIYKDIDGILYEQIKKLNLFLYLVGYYEAVNIKNVKDRCLYVKLNSTVSNGV